MRAASPISALLAAARTRVCARLSRALELPIALVSAPPGYDQSSVVRDTLAARMCGYHYVEIDAQDGNALGFLRAFVRAVGVRLPALASSFVAVYDRVADASDTADQLAMWVAENLKPIDATFVIEGLDAVTEGCVPEFLTSLIDRAHAGIRWILIVERSERFPIARWLAAGRLDLPVDAGDLALTESDFQSAGGNLSMGLSCDWLAKLCAVTGGWPAAVALALAGGTSLDLDAAPPEHAACYLYLADAMLATLSPRERAFIETTSLFRSFDAALLECAGLFDVWDTLGRLCDEAGVLEVDSAGTYCYDELFHEYTIARLQARGEEPFTHAAAAAADAYLRDGRYADALGMYVKLNDFAAVGTLLSAHGFALIDRGESSAVARALQAMPHDVLSAYPGALAVKATYESLHGKFDVAEAWFRLALSRLNDEAQRNEIVYRFGIDLVRRERLDVIELMEPVVSGIRPEAPLAAQLLALLAAAYALKGQLAQATLTIDRALQLLPRLVDGGSRARVLHQAAFVALQAHDGARARAFALESYAEACASYHFDVAARVLSVLYNIAIDYEQDADAARTHLEQLAELSVRAGSRQLKLYAILCLYDIEVLSGNLEQIERLNEQLQPFEVLFSNLTTETLLPAQALQAAWGGEFYRAYRLLEPSAEHVVDADLRGFRYAEIAVYAAAAGLRDEASTAAERALVIVRRMHSHDRSVTRALAYVALTFVLTRRQARAAKLLAELSPAGARRDGIGALVRVVGALAGRWSAGGINADLAAQLDELAARGLGGLARMIEALPSPETARSRIVQLTSAERDILGQLAAGTQPPEIASSSGRNVQRVGLAIASLCRKLGCSDAAHAVAVAVNERLLYDANVMLPEPVAG